MDLKDLKGKKTYIVVVATLCYALGGAVAGFLDWGNAILIILGALGIGAVRNGVESNKAVVPASQ